MGVIQPAHAFSQIAQQHAFSDMAILRNCLEGIFIRWSIIPTKTARPIQLKSARSIWASKMARACTEMMRCIGGRDGTSFPVEYWSHPVVQEGRTIGAVITFIDITERKQTEEALRRSEEQNRSLLQINNAIITNLTQEALLHSISEALHRVIGFDRCAITLYQPERDTFRFLAVEGELLSDYFQAGIEDRRSETSVGWVYDHQQSRVCGNLQDSAQFANERRLAVEGIHSICVLPMALQGKCIGTLSFVSRERDRYSKQDALFLQEVANQVVLAIQNMQSYDEIASLKAQAGKGEHLSPRGTASRA